MGIKGDKLKKDAVLAAELLLERLAPIEGVSMKKMFGGHGVFHDGKMFGIVDSRGNYFFKVDELNRSDYLRKGGVQHSKMPYFSIPQEIFVNQDKLIAWAKKAIEISK